VRIEQRLDGTMAIRFRDRYLAVTSCGRVRPTPKPTSQPSSKPAAKPHPSPGMREAMNRLLQHPGLPVWIAAEIDKTLTSDTLED